MTGVNAQCSYSSPARPLFEPCPEPGFAGFDPDWNENDLYGPSGMPQVADILQSSSNCWLGADLGAMALKQGQHIKDAIRYDSASRSFEVIVRAVDASGRHFEATVPVNQAELALAIKQGALGTSDDQACVDAAIVWPSVAEAAVAKVLARQLANTDDVATGLTLIANGGAAGVGMTLLLGERPLFVNFDPQTFQDPVQSSNSGGVATVGATSVGAVTREEAIRSVRSILQRANEAGLPIVLGVADEAPGAKRGDGLTDRHAYIVTGIQPDGTVNLRNTVGHNRLQPSKECSDWEQAEDPVNEGCDLLSAETSVSLSTLYDAGSIRTGSGVVHYGFTIGQL